MNENQYDEEYIESCIEDFYNFKVAVSRSTYGPSLCLSDIEVLYIAMRRDR